MMTDAEGFPESRRSTRVPLSVVIEAQYITGDLICEGETLAVNLHGALISTSGVLTVGKKIAIYVDLSGKRARAEVVHVDPEKPQQCGIALAVPQNIWGISLPPRDWDEVDLG